MMYLLGHGPLLFCKHIKAAPKKPLRLHYGCVSAVSTMSEYSVSAASAAVPAWGEKTVCRQEYWSGLPFPTPGDLPHPGIKPTSLASPALAGRFFTLSHLGSSHEFFRPQDLYQVQSTKARA